MNIRNKLAHVLHEQWRSQIQEVLAHSALHDDGTLTLNKQHVDLWLRLLNTEYEKLSVARQLVILQHVDALLDSFVE